MQWFLLNAVQPHCFRVGVHEFTVDEFINNEGFPPAQVQQQTLRAVAEFKETPL